MNSMIQTIDLTKKFGDFTANDHINLDVKEQEIKCIVGENGAGKSTMMNMLYGLLQPTSGKILIRGKEVTMNSPIDAIANGIGMVHQHFKLVPSLTVYENILLGAEIKKKNTPFVDQKEEIRRVEKLIEENHFELNATDKIEDISVGGRQRVEILKMLYRNVDILILDEPINGLDPIGIAEVRSFIRELCDTKGKTILISSHILSEISLLADDIGIIDHGALLEEESLAELEQKSSKHIRFTLSDTAQAARILERTFHENHFSIQDDHNLRLHNLDLPVGKIVTAFVENGLEVSEAHTCEESLEDYFKRVTGGEGIAQTD